MDYWAKLDLPIQVLDSFHYYFWTTWQKGPGNTTVLGNPQEQLLQGFFLRWELWRHYSKCRAVQHLTGHFYYSLYCSQDIPKPQCLSLPSPWHITSPGYPSAVFWPCHPAYIPIPLVIYKHCVSGYQPGICSFLVISWENVQGPKPTRGMKADHWWPTESTH